MTLDLAEAAARLLARARHPAELCGVHNPWAPGAVQAEAWALLDACEAVPLVAPIRAVLGPDVILWDSTLHRDAAEYAAWLAEHGAEGGFWPVEPLAGAVALIATRGAGPAVLPLGNAVPALPPGPLLVARYMPATSRFLRDPLAPANRRSTEAEPLVNLARRPLWLVAGEDRAGNDLAFGFSPDVPRWGEGGGPPLLSPPSRW